MQDRGKKLSRWIYSVLTALIFTFGAFACGGGDQAQVGGIIGTVSFNTQACVPQQKIINFRNSDTQNPQRVMGVSFELGTNDNGNYKIDKVVVGATEYQPSSNLAQDVLIPAGGIMSVYTTYTPRVITTKTGHNLSYLDLFLNGPKLGILQIKLDGESDTAKEGCSSDNKKTFKVTKATFIMNHQDFTSGQPREFDLTIKKGDLNLGMGSDGSLTLSESSDFPTLTLPLPPELGAPVPELDITMDAGSYTGTLDDQGKMELQNLNLKALVIPIPNVTLTTEPASITQPKGSVSVEGKRLADNKATLVAAIPVPDDSNLAKLKDGAFGLKIEIEAQQ